MKQFLVIFVLVLAGCTSSLRGPAIPQPVPEWPPFDTPAIPVDLAAPQVASELVGASR